MDSDTGTEDWKDKPNRLPFKRIRSAIRHRILERLTEGRATVTQISKSTRVRLPHTSAELKRLRKEGLVQSDEETGTRGACLALTAKGWEILRADEIARIRELSSQTPPEGSLGRLISVMDNHLLIAFIRRPTDGPIALPTRPLESAIDQVSNSDWVWIEPRERIPRWISSETFLPATQPPRDVTPSSLSAWGAESQVWGLQRFKLVDESIPLRLAIGSWFGQLDDLTLVPVPNQVPVDGKWRLGTLGIGGPAIRLDEPLIAIGLDRMSREALLSSSSPNALTIAPQQFDIESKGIPIGVLKKWVELVHPRLKDSEREERLRLLNEILIDPQPSRSQRRIDDGTWRRFRKHWGNATWSNELLSKGDWIDTSTLSNQAEFSLIQWVLEESSIDIVVEARPSSHPVFPTARLPSNVRLVLTTDWKNPPLTNRIDAHAFLPSMWSQLTLFEGLELSVNLSPAMSIEALKDDVIWTPPSKASEVESSKEILGGEVEANQIPILSVDDDEERLLRAAILTYPTGNSNWSNQMESHYPIVSWIASPSVDRWSRWERIGPTLGPDWIGLMKSEDIPNEYLSKAALGSPQHWHDQLTIDIRQALRNDVEMAHQLRRSAETSSPEEAAWIAHILLSEVAWLPYEIQADLSTWSLDRFREAPPLRCAATISGLDWLANQFPDQMLSDSEDWRINTRNAGFSKPQNHDLHLWALLTDWYKTGNRPHYSVMALILQQLPEEWWAPFAEIILTALSDDPEGIPILAEMDVAWPSLIMRPEGEIHRIPGNATIEHGGVRRTLLARLERLTEHELWSEQSPGAKMIQDLAESLRAARDLSPPNFGLMHPMVGWLGIPIHRWPPKEVIQMSSGDHRITARLAKMQSGWHVDLSRNPMEY